MGIIIKSIALMLLLMTSFLGMAYCEDATDGATSAQSSRDEAYDITDEITAAFEALPITMRAGTKGTILDSIPVEIDGKTWWEIEYKNDDGTTTKGWSWDAGLKTEISNGDEVKTTSDLNVRDAADIKATSIKVMPPGRIGTVLDTPPKRDEEGRTWWEIEYKNDDGTTTKGWSADVGLKTEISRGDEITTTSGLNVRIAPDGVSLPSPSSLNTWDRRGIISYGKHQFILASQTENPGSLYNVLAEYTTLSQSDISKKILEEKEGKKSYLLRVKEKDATLKDDLDFLQLLKDAGSEPEMVQAQDDVFAQMYYDPGKQRAETDGLKSALAIVIYTDTQVQGGLDDVSKSTAKRFEGKELGKDYTEKEWLTVFLEERTIRLQGLGLDDTLSRVEALQKLVNDDNLDLKHGDEGNDFDQIAIGDKGKVYAIDAPRRLQEAGTSRSLEDDASEGKASLAALMLQIGSPDLAPEITWFSDQSKEGNEEQETSGTSYNSIRQDPWYVDIYSLPRFTWEYNDRSQYPRPPAPLYLSPGGVPNIYGYDWIYHQIPGGVYPYGDYTNWVIDYLDSIGQSGPSAGYGLLGSEDSEF